MKRIINILAALLGMILLVIGCAPLTAAPAAPTPTPPPLQLVNACYTATTGPNLVAWYALDKGLFQKHGLDVKLVEISSSAKALSAVIAGQVNICQMSGNPVVNALAAGEDPVMVGGVYNAYQYSFLVAPSIQIADDLRGKTVATTGAPGSASDTAMRLALRQLGLRPDDEVKLLNLDDTARALASVEVGQVVGTVAEPPLNSKAQERGMREMVNLAGMNVPYPRLGVITTRRYLKDNRDVVVRFMRAMTEAIAAMKQDAPGTKAVLAKWLQMDATQDAQTLQGAYEALVQKNIAPVPRMSAAAIQAVIDEAKVQNPKVASLQPEDVIDHSIVDELEQSGFIAALYR